LIAEKIERKRFQYKTEQPEENKQNKAVKKDILSKLKRKRNT